MIGNPNVITTSPKSLQDPGPVPQRRDPGAVGVLRAAVSPVAPGPLLERPRPPGGLRPRRPRRPRVARPRQQPARRTAAGRIQVS